jgi:hypothetical protein
VPKSFEENRDTHIKQAQAFLNAAQVRASDNLPYRTALSDAVEAIKHILQAYLWQRVAAIFPRDPAGVWQEVAIKGSMPDMLNAAAEAGLQLGDINRAIRDLNDLRNQYIHGLPQRGALITKEAADRAVQVAGRLDERVRRALNGNLKEPAAAVVPTPPPPAPGGIGAPGGRPAQPATAAASSAAAPSIAARPPSTPPTAPVTQPAAAAAATPPAAREAEAGEGGDEESGDTDVDLNKLPRAATRRGRTGWLVALAAVLALVVGLAGGVVLGYPLGQGHVPPWLPAGLIPATATPPTASATATPATASGPFVVGALLITPSACGITPATLTLRDTGAAAVSWSAGSADSAGAAFALAPAAPARPTLVGRLAPGASVTLIVTGIAPGAGHVVVVADGGALAVPLGAC